MSRVPSVIAVALLFAVPAQAQTVEVKIVLPTAQSPTVDNVGPIYSYTPTCGLPAVTEQAAPIVNPPFAFYVLGTGQCRLDIAAQLSALPAGTYRATMRIGTGVFAPLSNVFTVQPLPPPPPVPPPSPPSCTLDGVSYVRGDGPRAKPPAGTSTGPNQINDTTDSGSLLLETRIRLAWRAGFDIVAVPRSTYTKLVLICARPQ